MDTLMEYLPALLPLILLELGLAIFALIHLIRHPQVRICLLYTSDAADE